MEPPGPTSHRADDQVSLPEGWVRLCSKKAGETFFHHFETGRCKLVSLPVKPVHSVVPLSCVVQAYIVYAPEKNGSPSVCLREVSEQGGD